MTDLIDRNKLIKALNKISMEHHESHIPMVEHDFRELIHEMPSTTKVEKDGTLIITVDDYSKVKRVLVQEEQFLGGLFYKENE